MFSVELLNRIYHRLGDELSKEIFKNRLMYSITGDSKWVYENVKSAKGGLPFLEKLDQCAAVGQIVIFGAGVWGKDLYQVTKAYPWKCFVDSNPKADEFEGVPVIAYDAFVKDYHGEYIFISSRIYYREMYQQLIDGGISHEKIINVGKMLDELAAEQYFDLDYLQPAEGKEVFVDAGSFDGMTSIYFNKWSKEDSFVFAFEPDARNGEKCHKNLSEHQIQHTVIPKGVWSEETELHFQAVANGTSNISAQGDEVVAVTSLDRSLGDEKITFIKMDIEGSESHALLGAKRVISANRPKMAISVYHKPEDIWEIPEIILQYDPEYQFYLRHYSLTDFETVLYALP